MSEPTCATGCTRPRPTNTYLCPTCHHRLEQQLAEIPWLIDELNTVLGKQARYTEPNRGGKGAKGKENPLPINLDAADQLTRIARVLGETWRTLHRDNQRPPTPNPLHTSAWLGARIDTITRHPQAGTIANNINDATRAANNTIDRPAERRYVGPCDCGRDIYTRPNASDATCRGCQATYDVAEMVDWMRNEALGKLVTAREAATLLCKLGIETKAATVNKWHGRKKLTARGTRDGANLYLVDDLLAINAKDGEK